jgi:hypothetical protein
MTDRELMQMALDLIEPLAGRTAEVVQKVEDAKKALRDRLAQPEPGPVAECSYPKCQATNGCVGACSKTAPLKREWVGLTDEDVREAFNAAYDGEDYGLIGDFSWFAELIEAKLKEKNT